MSEYMTIVRGYMCSGSDQIQRHQQPTIMGQLGQTVHLNLGLDKVSKSMTIVRPYTHAQIKAGPCWAVIKA